MALKDFNFDLKQIRSFLEVVNEKSFTNASRNLKISQASISHQIGQLEKMLGIKLIHRNSQDFSLTGEGRIFVKFCHRLMKDVDGLKSDMQAGTFGGVVSIMSSSIPGAYIFPEILSAFKKNEKDGIFFKLEIGNSREAVEKIKLGEADLAIVGREIRHPALTYTKIFEDQVVLVAGKDYSGSVKITDLKTIPLILRESGSGTKNAAETYLHELDIIPSELNVVMECSSPEGIKEAVIKGLGLAFISKLAIEEDVKSGKLKIIGIKGLDIHRDFFLVTSNVKALHEPAGRLVSFILDNYKKG
ncbi:MAG TPA: LysR family transcriptional regulator [Spirochaetota bacterium]|nr:LysR family transcriptional regulator [Spirochaetota bacterium]HPS87723.1 LysR family transcriptional regulator [Spirochaetota bacterium]